ncbi:MAG: FG-GAP-like repeat-containing protein [Thermoplasmata archaeon]
MTNTRAVVCAVLLALVLPCALPIAPGASGYEITRFADGALERELVFTAESPSATVQLSIPRATNLSRAELSISSSASSVFALLMENTFASGSVQNLTRAGELRIVEKEKWWNTSWAYRAPISVNSGFKPRRDITVIADINISLLFTNLGIPGRSLDERSLRIIEVDANGDPIVFNASLTGPERYEVPMRWSKAPEYSAPGNEMIRLEWLLSGETPQSTERRFYLYFDDTSAAPKPAGVAGLAFWDDVLFSNWAPYPNFGLLYRNSNGNFSNVPSVSFPTNASAAVITGDFNGDGYKDVIFANWYNGSSYEITSDVFAGGPAGHDEIPEWSLLTCGTFGCAVGDLNGDGIDDVVFPGLRAGSNYSIGSRVYLGSAAGPSNDSVVLFYTEGATDAAIADFNRDGLNDIVFSNAYNGSSGNIYSFIYYGGVGGINPVPDVRLPSQNAYAVEAADLNRDGWMDIVIANRRNTSLSGSAQYNINSFVYYGGPGGFNSTPDVLLPTYGAYDAKIADLNMDGWLDIIFANYNDGATYNTMSQAYFGGPSGFSTTPGAYFQTSWAYGVSVGDVNNDGIPDVAFANYYNGVTTDINSTIFLGPCIGLQQPDIFLPTHGANDVHIADVDRYDMTKDLSPPIVHPGVPEGRFVRSGTYTSAQLVEDERILSASAVWNATIPDQPSGSYVTVELSGDGGVSWTEISRGERVDFETPTRSLMYRVSLYSDPRCVDTPVFEDITIAYVRESYPHNVTFDLGDDGTVDWRWPGKFPESVTVNESTPGVAGKGLVTLLMELVPRVGIGNQTVPLRLASERPGVLRLRGLSIAGNYAPEALLPIPDVLMLEDTTIENALNFNNFFRDLDGDPLQFTLTGGRNVNVIIAPNGSASFSPARNWFGTERLTVRAADPSGERAELSFAVEVRSVEDPPFFTAPLPDVSVPEGESAPQLFNLLDYIEDEDTVKTALIFSVVEVSNRNVSVLIDSSRNVEVSSRLGWNGTAVARIKVFDGELSAFAQLNITVERANRPPVVSALPSISLQQGSVMERAFNLRNYTSDPDTPIENLVFAIESNNDPSSGVSIDTEGWVHIQPASEWKGTALVVVNVTDGQWTVRASFTVTVLEKPATPPPTPAPVEDRTLDYILIALLIVLVVAVIVDVGLRVRKPPATPPQAGAVERKEEVGAPPEEPESVVEPRPTGEGAVTPAPEEGGVLPPVPPAGEGAPESVPGGGEVPAPGETAGPRAPEALIEEREVPPEGPAPPTPKEETGFEVVSVEEMPGAGVAALPEGGAEVPQVPESVPDVTPPEAGAEPAPEAPQTEGEAGAAPRAGFEELPAPAAPGVEERPAGGVPEERPAAPAGTKSAAELLAVLEGRAAAEAAPQPSPPPPQEAPPPGPAPAPGPVGEEGPPGEVEQQPPKPVTKVRCAGCRSAIPVFTTQRPLVVTCPHCGRMGMLK